MRAVHTISVLAILLTALGCGADIGVGIDELGQTEQGIHNGTWDQHNTEYPAVVHVSASGGSCSGTFIAPHYVLTAGHCFVECNDLESTDHQACWGTFQHPSRSGKTAGRVREGPGPNTVAGGVTAQHDTDWAFFPGPTPAGFYYDVALLHVTTAFTGTPIHLMDPDEQILASNLDNYIGEQVTLVGYSPNGGEDNGEKRYGTTEIIKRAFGQRRSMYLEDHSSDCHMGDHGDSGGPALLANSAGVEELAGVGSSAGKEFQCSSYYSYVPPGFVEPHMDEHGDACTDATVITSSAWEVSAIEHGGDVDVFRLDLPLGGDLTVQTTSSYSTDTLGTLRNAGCNDIAENDDGGAGRNFRIHQTVTAGTYYVAVRHYYQTTGQGPYALSVTFLPGDDDHANTPAGATVVSIPSSTAGTFEHGNDADYFRVQLSTPGTLTAYTTYSTNTFGILQDSDWTVLATDDDSGAGFNFRIQKPLAAGTYYVGVRPSSGTTTGPYLLHVQVSSGDDHSNSCSGATSVGLYSNTAGSLSAGDHDFFRIWVPNARWIAVRTSGTTDTYGTLYTSSCSAIAEDDDGGSGTNFRIQKYVSAGAYFVRVRHYYAAGTGNYTFQVNPID